MPWIVYIRTFFLFKTFQNFYSKQFFYVTNFENQYQNSTSLMSDGE